MAVHRKTRRLTNDEMIYPLAMVIFNLKPEAEEYSCGGFTLKVGYDKLKDKETLDVYQGKQHIACISLSRRSEFSWTLIAPAGCTHSEICSRVRKLLVRMTHVVPLNDYAAKPDPCVVC